MIRSFERYRTVHVVEDTLGDVSPGDLTSRNLSPVLRENVAQLKRVFTASPPVTTVWEVLPGEATLPEGRDRPTGCAAPAAAGRSGQP